MVHSSLATLELWACSDTSKFTQQMMTIPGYAVDVAKWKNPTTAL
jgi:hypothetical protein